MLQREQVPPKRSDTVGSDETLRRGDTASPPASLEAANFNAKLREVLTSVKHGFLSEGHIFDFEEVFQDKIQVLNEGDNLSVLLTPLATSGAHGRAYLQLFDAGPNGENLLRFCQAELGMGASEAQKLLAPPKSRRSNKEYDEVLPLSLTSALPWVRDFMERNCSVPDTHISLAVRRINDTVSVGIVIGFEPLTAAPSTSLVPVEKRGLFSPTVLSIGKGYLGPLVGTAQNLGEMAQVFLCLPTAGRRDTLGCGWYRETASTPAAPMSLAHILTCGVVVAMNTLFVFVEQRGSRLPQWDDLSTIGKYGAIVCACNLASAIYEWGYARYKREQQERQDKNAPLGE